MTTARKFLARILTVVLIWTAAVSSYGLASKAQAALPETGANPSQFISKHKHAAVHEHTAVHKGVQTHHHERSSKHSEKQNCFYICAEAVSVFDVKEYAEALSPPETKVVMVIWPARNQPHWIAPRDQKFLSAQGPPGFTGSDGLARLLKLNARIRD